MKTSAGLETLTKTILTSMSSALYEEKIVIIGDIHGRTMWKEILKREEDATRYIFLGDYLDPYNLPLEAVVNPYGPLTPARLVDNFKEILDFKLSNRKKVNLLVGNHDLHYMVNTLRGSRYDHDVAELLSTELDLKKLVKNDVLQLCYNTGNMWFSHAGFTNTWLRDNRLKLDEKEINDHFKELILSNCPKNPYGFIDRDYMTDIFGDDIYQGPLWIRPRALKHDSPADIIQLIGHTQNNLNVTISKVMLCDSLMWNRYYVYTVAKRVNGVDESFETKIIE
jgi:hypothetical protein